MGCHHSQKIRKQVRQQPKENNNDLTRKNIDLTYSIPISNSRGLHARFQKRSRRRVIL